MTTFTTLNKIREHGPCAGGWAKLLRYLDKTQADDEPLALTTILDSNGLDDALWCLRACDGIEKKARLYAVWCVRQVQHLLTDPRSLAALDVAERYAEGEATGEELTAAWAAAGDDAAWAAAGDDAAGNAARTAARNAARAAARDAAWDDAAWAAAGAAAGAAAKDAAGNAARTAAWAAARAAQAEEFRRRFG